MHDCFCLLSFVALLRPKSSSWLLFPLTGAKAVFRGSCSPFPSNSETFITERRGGLPVVWTCASSLETKGKRLNWDLMCFSLFLSQAKTTRVCSADRSYDEVTPETTESPRHSGNLGNTATVGVFPGTLVWIWTFQNEVEFKQKKRTEIEGTVPLFWLHMVTILPHYHAVMSVLSLHA